MIYLNKISNISKFTQEKFESQESYQHFIPLISGNFNKNRYGDPVEEESWDKSGLIYEPSFPNRPPSTMANTRSSASKIRQLNPKKILGSW